jgi:membrane protein implicated in regulation of membrane protease activity
MSSELDPSLAWAILGLTLVIIEMFTGTFYLLMLGVAAFGAAAAAWLGQELPVQALIAAAIAAAGCYWVHAYRVKNAAAQMPHIDAGQPANFESWIDEGARLAKVRYRGASWDAVIDGEGAPQGGALLYVLSANGNTLKVTARRPG